MFRIQNTFVNVTVFLKQYIAYYVFCYISSGSNFYQLLLLSKEPKQTTVLTSACSWIFNSRRGRDFPCTLMAFFYFCEFFIESWNLNYEGFLCDSFHGNSIDSFLEPWLDTELTTEYWLTVDRYMGHWALSYPWRWRYVRWLSLKKTQRVRVIVWV